MLLLYQMNRGESMQAKNHSPSLPQRPCAFCYTNEVVGVNLQGLAHLFAPVGVLLCLRVRLNLLVYVRERHRAVGFFKDCGDYVAPCGAGHIPDVLFGPVRQHKRHEQRGVFADNQDVLMDYG